MDDELTPENLASDGDAVLPGIEAPGDSELLSYLAEQGWTEKGPAEHGNG